MYWFQKIKISFLFLLAMLASSFLVMQETKAYEYDIWVSRQYYDEAEDTIVGVGWQSYTQEYFTGLWFCTWYYYLNHKKHTLVDPLSLVEQVLWYDSNDLIINSDYLNYSLIPGAAEWKTINFWPDIYNWKDIFKFEITKKSAANEDIPYNYTIWRFNIINKDNTKAVYTISGHYDALSPAAWDSTYMTHINNSSFIADADTDYAFDIKYYAQPCVPDMPTTSFDRALINWSNGSSSTDTLSRIPAVHDLGTNSYSWRPVTIGYADMDNETNFIPAELNIWSVDKDITFDDWIYIWGITEPGKSSNGPAYDQKYYYADWVAKWSTFDVLDSSFVAAPASTSNQWWIDPSTIEVTIEFMWVDRTDFDDVGENCTIVVSGETPLWLSGLWYSWNRNQLWYEVNISSGTLRSLAYAACPWIASNADNIDLKRETVANISWDAYDLSNSMIISQEFNTVSYANPNRITGTTWYSFNSYSSDPILELATDTKDLNDDGSTVYNIPIDNDKLLFTGTDDYAWVDPTTLKIVVSGYNSSIDKSASRRESWTPDYSYTFDGVDINGSPYGQEYNRYDYTGWVDFATNWVVETGMHFTVSFEAEDYVWNKTTEDYVFRTPTYPNAPHGGPEGLTAQTNQSINQINILNDIDEDDRADGDEVHNYYTYTGYYPSSTWLIDDLEYMSGGSLINATTNLVLTANNGNVGWATVVTMTGLTFTYDWADSYISWTPHVSSGWEVMTDYLDTTFTFEVLATNIYGITGVITYNMTVAPSCTESPGCTDPVYVYWGASLDDAKAQRAAAMLNNVDYRKANHRYPHWFAEIKQTGPNFKFLDVDDDWIDWSKVLYCATTGNNMMIRYDGYTGPYSNPLSNDTETYTGTNLVVEWSGVKLFGVVDAVVTANYALENTNWTDKMTIYVNRPLTGKVFYSVCELTGWVMGDYGCPEISNHNWTWDVNWTKLTDQDTFTMTGWVEWWWITGSEATYWGTATVSNGGGTRKYVKTITGDLREDINTGSTISIENRTWSTDDVNHEVYWIDNTPVSMTWSTTVVANQSAVVTLSGYNTGVLSAVGQPNLIWDDQYIVTKFSGDVQPLLFKTGFGFETATGQFYIEGDWAIYKMIHEIIFAQDREGEICVEDRAGNESCMAMNVTGIGTMKELVITVRPAFRPDPSEVATWYSLIGSDFWFWVKSGSVWTQNYNSAKWADPKIDTNENGTGLVYIMTPATGAEYLVVFKWSGTLSAWFTGIWDNSITDMNFFSGSFADNLASDYVYKYNGESYLKVGDVAAAGSWAYDYINDADFFEINNNLTIGTNSIPNYRYDFDINNVISSMEQSMVLQAWGSHWFIGWLEFDDIIPMTWFIDL